MSETLKALYSPLVRSRWQPLGVSLKPSAPRRRAFEDVEKLSKRASCTVPHVSDATSCALCSYCAAPLRVFGIEYFLRTSERRRHEMTVRRVGDVNIPMS